MLVSLVLATVYRSDEVGRCLHSLVKQTDQNFEVFLVDQNVDDRLVPWVNEVLLLGLKLSHLRIRKSSLSGARNRGIEKCQGDIIGFPDDDCWYEADVIARLREAFSDELAIDGIVANWVEQTEARKKPTTEAVLSGEAWRRFRGGDASSISLFFRHSLLSRLGGFDERIGMGRWFGAGEETDFILRALAAGAHVQRLPSARIHHLFGVSTNDALGPCCQNTRRRAHGTGAIYAKHRLGTFTVVRGLIAPLLMPVVLLSGWHALAIGFCTMVGRIEGLLRWGWGKP